MSTLLCTKKITAVSPSGSMLQLKIPLGDMSEQFGDGVAALLSMLAAIATASSEPVLKAAFSS